MNNLKLHVFLNRYLDTKFGSHELDLFQELFSVRKWQGGNDIVL